MEYKIIKSNIKNIYIQIKDGEVIVKAPKTVSKKYIEEVVSKKEKWILKKLEEEKQRKLLEEQEEPLTRQDAINLKQVVLESANKFGKNIGEFPEKVTIKNMKYAWGSCTSKRNISINMKLAKKKKEIIEYVVLHELCHLKYMNHSKEFWKLVESNMPDYKKYRKELKKCHT